MSDDTFDVRAVLDADDDTEDSKPQWRRSTRTCSVQGCPKTVEAFGLCRGHRERQKRGRPVEGPLRVPKRDCDVKGCTKPHFGRGYCNTHYARWKKGIPLDMPIQPCAPRLKRVGTCRIAGCGRTIKARFLCAAHYERRRNSPGKWSGPVDLHGGVNWPRFALRPEVYAALATEAKARGVRRNHVIREWLEEVYQRKQEAKRQAEMERMDYGRQPTGPKVPDASRQRAARIREVVQRDADITAEQLMERFGLTQANAHQLLSRARKAQSCRAVSDAKGTEVQPWR